MFTCFCGSKKKQQPSIKASPYYRKISSKLTPQEIQILKLIFNDLSARDISNKINQQNFLLFFNLNGLWGDKLYSIFDQNASTKLNLDEFIYGISLVAKSSKQDKIYILYEFLGGKEKQGIEFQEFLKMLYHYPKQDLKKILNDGDFISQQVMRHIKPLRKAFSTAENKFQCQYEQSSMNCGVVRSRDKGTYEDIYADYEYNAPGTPMCFDFQDKKFEVKSVNFNKLVMKFARQVFLKHGLTTKDKLNYNQFQDWVINHPKLYNSYYDGFHNFIWEYHNQKPVYLTIDPEKQSEAILTNDTFDKKPVYLLLLHTTLLICSKDKDRIIYTICLQGLTVSITEGEKKFPYVFEISHRNGVYPAKKLFFSTKQLFDEWLQQLHHYKGQSIKEMYSFSSQIGAGRYSSVYKAIDNKSQQEVAIKVIQTYKLSEEQRNTIAHESKVMDMLKHPSIVTIFNTIQTKTHLYIITEIIKGQDLFDFVLKQEYLREFDCAVIIGAIIQAIMYIHKLGIVHRDLKPQNIMITTKEGMPDEIQRVKLIDFGFANFIQHLIDNPSDVVPGTPGYLAPENYSGGIEYQSDIFSIGVILYFCLSGTLPFDSVLRQEIMNNTLKCEFEMEDHKWQYVSPQAKDLIRKMLQRNPKDRISLEQALRHEWFLKRDKYQTKRKSQKFFGL